MKFPKISFGDEWNNLKKFDNLSDFERSIVFYAEKVNAKKNEHRFRMRFRKESKKVSKFPRIALK